REMSKRAPPGQPGRANLTNREFVYRPAFELGRHIIGYELQEVLAGVDWFSKDSNEKNAKIGVMGYGEGGMLSLYAGAVDNRILFTGVSGYFAARNEVWNEPIDRNVFGRIERFLDGDLSMLIAPRRIFVEWAAFPKFDLPSEGGAPAKTQPA